MSRPQCCWVVSYVKLDMKNKTILLFQIFIRQSNILEDGTEKVVEISLTFPFLNLVIAKVFIGMFCFLKI